MLDSSGLIETADGRYVLAMPASGMTPAERQRSVLLTKAAPASPAPAPVSATPPAPKAASTATADVLLRMENSRLRRKLAEKPTEATAPKRDPLASKGLGDNMARYVRGVRFTKPRQPKNFS